jgi:cerevisin
MKSLNLYYFFITAAASASRFLSVPFAESLNVIPSQEIPNQYIVTFKPQSTRSGFESLLNQFNRDLPKISSDDGIFQVYDTLIQGAAIRTSANPLNLLRSLPYIANIEIDQVVNAFDSQSDAPWGLARISQRDKLSGSPYTYNYKENAGQGVNVYVIDTGINISHNDFEGRAVWGKTIPKGLSDKDENGHGTHCAGTVGGKTYGVAKKATLIAVRVLNKKGSGSNSDVIAGIEWAAKDQRYGIGKVISMSLGGTPSSTLDQVVNKAADAGIAVVVAAGNDNLDATTSSPARAEKAITVGATNIKDERAYFSNWGSKIDIFGPGVDIKSAWIGSNDATNTISGTSMACPHIAGIAATFISQGTSAIDVKEKIQYVSTKDAIFSPTILSPNRLGYNDYESS